jgi:hypothetical protein
MHGSLDPEERIMSKLIVDPYSTSVTIPDWYTKILSCVADLEWTTDDEITVELGGTQVSGIDVGEEYNKKWQSPIGTRKYNKDCFIIIKNQSRRDLTGSLPMDREHKPQHPYTPTNSKDIVVNMDGGVGGSWEVTGE